MSGEQSLIHDGRAVVRLRAPLRTRRRLVMRHGLFAGLVSLPLEFALELVEAGQAKMPRASSRGALRAAVHRARETAGLLPPGD